MCAPTKTRKVDAATLVRQARGGNQRALDRLLRQNYDRMYRLALKHCSNPEMAKDAVQESCIQIMRHLGNLKRDDRFHSWMGRIVINCVRLQHRKNGRLVFLGTPIEPSDRNRDVLPDDLIIHREELGMVEGFLQTARRGDYDLFARLYVGGDSVKKVSEETGVTTSAIKTRVHRARHRLKKYMTLRHERTTPPMCLESASVLAG